MRPRDDPRTVMALLTVLRRVLAELRDAGANVDADPLLKSIDDWLADGGTVLPLKKAAPRFYKLLPERSLSRGPQTVEDHAWFWGKAASALCWALVNNSESALLSGTPPTRVAWWETYGVPGVLNDLAAAVPKPEHAARKQHLDELYTAARAELEGTTPRVPKAPRAKPGPRSDPKLLAESAALLAPPLRPLLKRLGAERRPRQHGERGVLERLLKRRGYLPHAAALDFERDFGGLCLPEPGGEEDGLYTRFGPWAWLHEHDDGQRPEGASRALIPVFDDPRGVGYLDAEGRGHVEDEIEGMLDDLDIPSGEALVSGQILFLLTLLTTGRNGEGRRGAEWADQLGATPIPCFTKTAWRWWASEQFVVREYDARTEAWALDTHNSGRLAELGG